MTFKQHCLERFGRNLQQLIKLYDLDAPDNVLALAMGNLIQAAEGAFGEELYQELLKRRNGANRQAAAYCQHCDNQVTIQRSHAPICELCDANFEKYADEMEKELGKDIPEDES